VSDGRSYVFPHTYIEANQTKRCINCS